ncbi:MAG: hypothetical protein BGO49_13775 [Planctomycetales bacterium 71-10]|nr:MAG: hypothetical protein BGO49_13775 [Planctomycetales bacterium 71-10]
MVKVLRGVIRGRTIELDEDAGIADGRAVQVVVRSEVEAPALGRRSAAGAMAEHWSEEDDRLLDEIEQDRHRPSTREIPG